MSCFFFAAKGVDSLTGSGQICLGIYLCSKKGGTVEWRKASRGYSEKGEAQMELWKQVQK